MEFKPGKEYEQQVITQNLKDAGCDDGFIDHYFELGKIGKESEQLRHLTCHRCELLDKIHTDQKKLDCLDYLIYTIKKGHPSMPCKMDCGDG